MILLVLKFVIHGSVVKRLHAIHPYQEVEGMVVKLQAAKPVTTVQD